MIDMDPQGNASTGLGISTKERNSSTYDLLVDGSDITDLVQKTMVPGLQIIPANSDLSKDQTDALSQFDYILIDCPPSLNLLTINSLVAAHYVLVPLQCEFFALEGLSQLMLSIREVRQSINPDLKIQGVVLTMYDGRNNLSRDVAHL